MDVVSFREVIELLIVIEEVWRRRWMEGAGSKYVGMTWSLCGSGSVTGVFVLHQQR